MRIRELVTVRLIVAFVCFTSGLVVGFLVHLRPVAVPARAAKEMTQLRADAAAMDTTPQAELVQVKMQVYQGRQRVGVCVAEVTADKMMCPSAGSGKVFMLNPHVRRFTVGGDLVLELWGDKGTATIEEAPNGNTDFSDITVEGSARMRRYALKKKEDDSGETSPR